MSSGGSSREGRRLSGDAGSFVPIASRRIHVFGFLLFFTVALGVLVYSGFPSLAVGDDDPESQSTQRRLSDKADQPLRILYIVTSLAEFNNGRRYTGAGSDRFADTLVPVVAEGVESMLSFGYRVDVYLICHFTLKPERLDMFRQKLPPLAGLDVWDDATPFGYKMENANSKRTYHVTRGLARQHRFVIKDKLADYDMFVVFEDDMLIKGDHVKTYLEMSKELARLRTLAPDHVRLPRGLRPRNSFHGNLTKTQLSRMFPGFMRVEVLLNETQYGAQDELDPVPVDLDFDGVNRTVDPRPCCWVSSRTTSKNIPLAPTADKLFVWETGIKGLSVREVPGLGWVTMLAGTPHVGKANYVIGDYWSGRDGALGKLNRDIPGEARFLNNMGGWMATRQQVWEWHTEQCDGGMLPPFDPPFYQLDGLDLRNVCSFASRWF